MSAQAVEKPRQAPAAARPPATLRSRLESSEFRDAIARVLPKHLTPERFVRVAATTIMRTPKLAECDQTSFFNALLTLSQLGLEPDGRRAHLIPFNNRRRNRVECQLVVDYKGLAELVMRSGLVTKIHADVVCENDEFEYNCGEVTKHRIDLRKPRGKVYAVYSMVVYQGQQKADVMSLDEVEAVRKRSRAGNDGPWVTDYNEMAKKSVFRRLSKWLPLSSEFGDAVDADADAPELRASVNIMPAAPAEAIGSVVQAFEIPAAVEEPNGNGQQQPDDGDEKDEAAAGLAPQRETAATTAKAPTGSPTEHLATIVTMAGFSFEQWREWALAEGHITDREIPSFEMLSDALCVRLIRAKVGMLQQLAARKVAA